MIGKITSWSYSRYACYEECPLKAKLKFVDKIKEPSAPAMARGNNIHKLAEGYTKGLDYVTIEEDGVSKQVFTKKLPPELKLFADQFKELKKSKPVVEETWAFRKDWSQTTWDDWNGCWVRIKTDAACLDGDTLYVIDHKTGKHREGYHTQMSLYALGAMLMYPTVKTVNTQLWFLDHGTDETAEFTSDEFSALKKDWEKRVTPMLNDTRFAPKPGNGCRFCHFSKAKGGPCKY